VTDAREQTLGRYRLLSLLGEGGMGKVYKGYDPNLERNVAIKILPSNLVSDASRLSRFIQEARSASALNHPHVVAVYDIGEEKLEGSAESVRFISMELVEGKTLRELMGSGHFELRKGLKAIMQVAEALGAAHAAGIVHRDLKPENVMITNSGYAKVLDFGLAKLRGREDESSELSRTEVKGTEPGTVMGTVGYMSPEQAEGKPADHRSDIFSLGCLLYELAAGRRAFFGSSSVDTLHRIIHAEPEPLRTLRPDTPPELVRIVRKALAKDPDERYQSVRDLALDLRELLREIDSNPSGPAVSGSVPALTPPPRRWLWPALAALLLLALGAAFTMVLLRSGAAVAPSRSEMRITRVTASGKAIAAAISPDGKFVSYVVSDQGEQSLWVRQMASGQSLQLIPPKRDAYWGIAFAPDGSIYYGQKSAAAPAGAIYQISALGGTPRKIISEIDCQPTFSPDGKRMAFLRARFPTASESALIVANTDGTDVRTLATVRNPELFVPIFFAGASWSPDGKLIAAAIVNRAVIDARVVTVDVGNGAMKSVAQGQWRQVGSVAWMPDQHGIVAIAQGNNDSRNQVWYVSHPEGKTSQITNDLFDYRAVSLTADGKSLMVVASDIAADVWVYAAGATPKRITAAKMEGNYGLDALPDGRIVFTSLETGKLDLWIMNADGSGRTLLTRDEHENRSPVVTPDGKLIVYVSVTSKQTELCRMNADGSDRRVLAIATSGTAPAVSPDGRWVLYETVDTTTPARKNILVLSRVSIDGGPAKFLTDYLSLIPAPSPDGSRIALYIQEKPDSPFDLSIIPAEGGAPLKRLTFAAPFFSSRIRWTPDGRALIVNTAPSDRANLWEVPIDGAAPRRLTQFDEHTLMAFAPLSTGKGWVLSRGDLSRDAVLITGFR